MKILALDFELDRDEIRGHVPDASGVDGTIRLSHEEITIDFRLESGLSEGAAQAVRVALKDVKKLVMTGGVLKSPRLLLEVRQAELLRELPWADGCLCVMRFRHADGVALQQLIEEAEVRIAKVRTRREMPGDR